MTGYGRPPFRADHVGSLLRPERLLAAWESRAKGRIAAAELRATEDECIREAVKLQEDVGLEAITDGEFRRAYFHIDFLERIEGVAVKGAGYAVKFHGAEGDIEFAPPVLHVTGRLARPAGIATEDFAFLGSVTARTAKLCIPSPSMLHFRVGRGGIDREAYPDIEEFFADLARIYRE